MDMGVLEKSILKTVKYNLAKNNPLTLKELNDFLITDDFDESIKSKDLENCIKKLILSKKIILSDDNYVGFDEVELRTLVGVRIKAGAKLRRDIKDLKKIVKRWRIIKSILFVGMEVGKGERGELFVIARNDKSQKVRRLLSLYFKLKLFGPKFKINKVIAVNDLKKFIETKNIDSAYQILKIVPVLNVNSTYEKLIHQNMWIFEIFSNYPFEKISENYRIEVKKEKRS